MPAPTRPVLTQAEVDLMRNEPQSSDARAIRQRIQAYEDDYARYLGPASSTNTTGNSTTNTPAITNYTPTGSEPGSFQNLPSLTRSIPNLQDYTDLRALNPELVPGGAVTPQNQQVQAGEDMQFIGIDPNAAKANTAQAQATNAQAAQVGQVAQAGQVDTQALFGQGQNTYQAAKVGAPTKMEAAQDQFTEEELLTGQLAKILQPDENGQFPSWAAPALTRVQQTLAARGIDNSTMAGQAITAALLDAAVPIAQSNAASLQGIKLQNLSNRQQANLATYQAEIQFMLSDQAAENAARNFNASSNTQVAQFVAALANNINQFNATAANTINQFNAGAQQQVNLANASNQTQVSLNNAQMANALEQFNSQLKSQREQFNVQNANLIQQSNATWRRQLNTQNTQVQNEANRINALNTLQISNQAYDNIWQQFRDEATWLNTAVQKDADRNFQMAMMVKELELQGANAERVAQIKADQEEDSALWNTVGQLAGNIAGGINFGGGSSSSSGINVAANGQIIGGV